jgi:hypothetical protein
MAPVVTLKDADQDNISAMTVSDGTPESKTNEAPVDVNLLQAAPLAQGSRSAEVIPEEHESYAIGSDDPPGSNRSVLLRVATINEGTKRQFHNGATNRLSMAPSTPGSAAVPLTATPEDGMSLDDMRRLRRRGTLVESPMSAGVGTCQVCDKKAYPLEQVNVDGNVMHKLWCDCFNEHWSNPTVSSARTATPRSRLAIMRPSRVVIFACRISSNCLR